MNISYREKVRLMSLALNNCAQKDKLCLTVDIHLGDIKRKAKFCSPNIILLQEYEEDCQIEEIVPELAREMNLAQQYKRMGWLFFFICSLPVICDITIYKEAKKIEKEVRDSLEPGIM